jgi:RNA polymerase sigma factor FliA
MSRTDSQHPRVLAALPFVEQLARRVAATMPHSIDIGDLVQDGVLGLIDASNRFDEARGIKFETFAERRVRGAMIDALRKDAWPRGVRRQRRELEAAREELRRELGAEPSLADLASKVGCDEKRLSRTIVRINAIESTSPLASSDRDEATLPAVLVPSEPDRPDVAYARQQTVDRVRDAIAALPSREQTVISRYYYGEATMKEIGAEIGVNESRVSQLHARAIKRLRDTLEAVMSAAAARAALRGAILEFQRKPHPAPAATPLQADAARGPAVVVSYASSKRPAPRLAAGRRPRTAMLPAGSVSGARTRAAGMRAAVR